MPSINNMTRPELNDHARTVGIASPDIYPNIATLISAIDELPRTGRPGRIQEDIERGKKARKDPPAPQEPEIPTQPEEPEEVVHLWHPNMRVRVVNVGIGTLRRFDRDGLWTVEMDNGATVLTTADQLQVVGDETPPDPTPDVPLAKGMRVRVREGDGTLLYQSGNGVWFVKLDGVAAHLAVHPNRIKLI